MDAVLHLTKRREEHREDRSEVQFLDSLDQGAASFLQQGRPEKAMDYMEEAWRQRQQRLGGDNTGVLTYARGVARKIVPVACGMIEKGESQNAAQLLHRVEALLPSDLPREQCDLLTALSTAYRRLSKQTLSKQYALRALSVANLHPTTVMDRTNVYLTLCAALSSAGDHTEALDFALRAVQSAQEDLVESSLVGKSSEAVKKLPVLAVAYHNAGVEAEHIVKYDLALEWYQKALRFVRQHKEDCPRLRDLEKLYQTAVYSVDKKMREAAPYTASALKPSVFTKFASPKRTNTGAMSDRSEVRLKTSRPKTASRRILSPKLPSEKATKPPTLRLAFSRQHSPMLTSPKSTEASIERRLPPASPRHIINIHTESDLDAYDPSSKDLLELTLETSPRERRFPRPPVHFKRRTVPKDPPNTEQISLTDSFPKLQEVSLKSKIDEQRLPDSFSRKMSGSGGEENAPSSPNSSLPSSLQVSFRVPYRKSSNKEGSDEDAESNEILEEFRTVVMKKKVESGKKSEIKEDVKKEDREEKSEIQPGGSEIGEKKENSVKKSEILDDFQEIKEEKKKSEISDDFQELKEEKAKSVKKSEIQVDFTELKAKNAILIQKNIRRFLAKLSFEMQRISLKTHENRRLILRSAKIFSFGFGIFELFHSNNRVFASVTDPLNFSNSGIMELPSEIDCQTVMNRISFHDRELRLNPIHPKRPMENYAKLVKLQALIRGVLSRKRVSLMRISHRKGRKVIYRSCQHLNGVFITLCLVQTGSDLVVVNDTEELAKPIPEALKALSPAEIVEQIRLRGNSLDFTVKLEKKGELVINQRKTPRPIMTELPPPAENPASPSSALSQSSKTHSSDPEETLKPMDKLHSMEFVSDTGSESEDTLHPECEKEEVLIRQEKVMSSEVFIVTISRVEKGDIQVEAEPVRGEVVTPERSVYEERVVWNEYGCEEEQSYQSMELINDVSVVDGKVVLTRLYQPPPHFIQVDETDEDFSVPRIVICDSSSPAKYSITDSSQPTPTYEQLTASAIAIQSAWRKHLARSQLSLLKSTIKPESGKKVFSCYRLFPGKAAFSLQIYENSHGVAFKAINIAKKQEHYLELSQGTDYKTLNYEEISYKMWPNGSSLGVFLLDNLTSEHDKSISIIAKFTKGWLTRKSVKKLKNTVNRHLEACKIAAFDGTRIGFAAFQLSNKIQIECFRLYKTGKNKEKSRFAWYSFRELSTLYPSPLNMKLVIEDVVYDGEQISLKAQVEKLRHLQMTLKTRTSLQETRSIIRTSRKLDDKMWVVTMAVIGTSEDPLRPNEDDFVEFSAFSTSQQKPITVKTTVEELASLTKLPVGSIYPIGILTIQKLLKVRDGALIIDVTETVPEVNYLATYVQARVRGFLVRRRMMKMKAAKSSLVTCMVVSMEGAQWILYAYREPPFIKLESVHRINKTKLSTLVSDNIFSKFPPTLTKKRIIDNFVFPKLHIVTEEGARHLKATKSMQLQQSILEKHQGKIKVLTQNGGSGRETSGAKIETANPLVDISKRKGFGPLTSLILKPGGDDEGSLPSSPIPKPSKYTDKKPADSDSDSSGNESSLSPVPRINFHAEENSLLMSFVKEEPKITAEDRKSPEITRKGSRKETRTIPLLSRFIQKQLHSLLLRSGFEQDGRAYLVSMYGDVQAILVELEDQISHEKASKEVNLKGENVDNLEVYCTQVLHKLSVGRDSEGRLTVSVTDKSSEILNVLYKKSHYVSNRYCVVTVNETMAGIVVSCFDPERHLTLDLALGPRKKRHPDLLQKDLAEIVKRLRIGEVMGEATLTLALG